MSRFRLTPQKKPKLTENDVETACIDYLLCRGWYVLRLQAGRFKTVDGRWVTVGQKGLPDYAAIHCCYPGFLMETKAPGKGLEAHQADKHRELTQAYRLAVVSVDSVAGLVSWLSDHEARWQ